MSWWRGDLSGTSNIRNEIREDDDTNTLSIVNHGQKLVRRTAVCGIIFLILLIGQVGSAPFLHNTSITTTFKIRANPTITITITITAVTTIQTPPIPVF